MERSQEFGSEFCYMLAKSNDRIIRINFSLMEKPYLDHLFIENAMNWQKDLQDYNQLKFET